MYWNDGRRSRLALPKRKGEAKLFLPRFRPEKVVPHPLELFAFKLSRNVAVDDIIDNHVQLLRRVRIRQQPKLDLFLLDFSKLAKEISF